MDTFDVIMSHYQAGRLPEARQMLQHVLVSRPRDAQVHGFLSIVLLQLGEPSGALEHALQATRLSPRNSDAWVWLGNAYAALLRHEEALAQFDRALVFQSDNAAGWVGKILSLKLLGRVRYAAGVGEKAIKKCPADERVIATCAATLLAAGDPTAAWEMARRGLEAFPLSLELASVLAGSSNYPSGLSVAEVHESQLKYGRILDQMRGPGTVQYRNTREPGRKLRIGFVSSDLREHSVSYFVRPLLEHADREQCELYCYSTTTHQDAHTDDLKRLSDHWRDAAKIDDRGLCELVRADGIDVLIDLHGHTVGHRLGVFHMRPAPVQLTYCGYPHITGIRGIGYRMVDSITDPPGDLARSGGEQLLRMNGCFLCFGRGPHQDAILASELTRGGPVTFGSFNAIQKTSELTLRLWKSVLDSVGDSRLAVKAMALREPELKHAFLQRMADAGLDRTRIDILDPTSSVSSHLQLYDKIDIALDTLPYNGTTTTCEALSRGVPVVTLRGNCHASRVSASLLTAAGYPQWIAESEGEFAAIACTLAGDRAALAGLRGTIPRQLASSPLCNGSDFAKRFLLSVREAWMEWIRSSNS